jgi:hypothetical protein
MPLTDCERTFLAALIDEPTTDPFQGPATEELQRRDLYSTDLPHLPAGSCWESPPGPEAFGGQYQPAPPLVPWLHRETAVQRDRQVAAENGEQPRPWLYPPAGKIVIGIMRAENHL